MEDHLLGQPQMHLDEWVQPFRSVDRQLVGLGGQKEGRHDELVAPNGEKIDYLAGVEDEKREILLATFAYEASFGTARECRVIGSASLRPLTLILHSSHWPHILSRPGS